MSIHKRPQALKETGVSLDRAGQKLLIDLRGMIESARRQIARAVDAGTVSLYWEMGRRIRQDILHGKRAGYGEQIVQKISGQLAAEYGRGFSRTNIFNMIRFAEVFPDRKIVQMLSGQLGWSHFVEILYLDDSLKRNFYTEMCRLERWNVETLQKKINGMLFERTALAKKPIMLVKRELDALRKEDRITPDLVFRDPYVLDFLRLQGSYSERDLETTILREMESFILELGIGFSFVARQKRMTIDHEDYYLDLLFYHRKLKQLVAIELKLGKFRAADKGQMELYLRWLDRYEREPGEESPIGLILCAGKSDEQVELLQLAKSGIRVAQYLTELPPRKVLENKLHDAIRLARERVTIDRQRQIQRKGN